MDGKGAKNLYLKDAVCCGNYKVVQLLIDAGENPSRIAADGSTAANAMLKTGFKGLEEAASMIIFMIQCNGIYSSKVMDGIETSKLF